MLSESVELLTTHHKPWKAEYHKSPCVSSKDKGWGVGWWAGGGGQGGGGGGRGKTNLF